MRSWYAMTTAVLMATTATYGADATLSLDVASAYVFRGATYNDGLVLQPGMEVGGLAGLTFGVWGNLDLDDYDGTLEKGEFSELDPYVSYDLPVEIVDLSVGYTEYTYPMGANADREASVSIGKSAGPVDLAADVFYGVDGGIRKSLYVELSAGSEFELGCLGAELGATVAYANPDEGESGFSHFTATAGLSAGPVGASVTYIGQIDDKVLPDVKDGGGYDVEVVGMLSASTSF
jgi:uncharacterized protein (TIGR02001 family)